MKGKDMALAFFAMSAVMAEKKIKLIDWNGNYSEVELEFADGHRERMNVMYASEKLAKELEME